MLGNWRYLKAWGLAVAVTVSLVTTATPAGAQVAVPLNKVAWTYQGIPNCTLGQALIQDDQAAYPSYPYPYFFRAGVVAVKSHLNAIYVSSPDPLRVPPLPGYRYEVECDSFSPTQPTVNTRYKPIGWLLTAYVLLKYDYVGMKWDVCKSSPVVTNTFSTPYLFTDSDAASAPCKPGTYATLGYAYQYDIAGYVGTVDANGRKSIAARPEGWNGGTLMTGILNLR